MFIISASPLSPDSSICRKEQYNGAIRGVFVSTTRNEGKRERERERERKEETKYNRCTTYD